MENNLEKLGYDWIKSEAGRVDISSGYYCQTRDVFQARLEKMQNDLLADGRIKEDQVYIVSAIAGEIGNNSFDHNLGNWPDAPGVFFAYGFSDGKLKIVLADRGQGILKTLKSVKPELTDDARALDTAFNEKISGRAPENRGNGLKFVKANIKSAGLRLIFISGKAEAGLDEKMEIREAKEKLNGCLAILTV